MPETSARVIYTVLSIKSVTARFLASVNCEFINSSALSRSMSWRPENCSIADNTFLKLVS